MIWLLSLLKITNALCSLGDEINNDQKVRKVIRVLPSSWEIKASTLKELNDKDEMELISLIENLKTHEIEKKAREEAGLKRKSLLPSSLPPPSSMIKKIKSYLFLWECKKNVPQEKAQP